MQELQHWMQHNPIDPRARHRKNCLAQGTAADLTKGDKMEKPGAMAPSQGSWTSIILIYAIGVLGASTITQATADSLPWMLAMRVVEGVGYACISVAAIAMMTRITQGARRNIALTLWSSYIPMSFAVPLLLASHLAGTGQWRWAFSGHALLLGALLVVAVSCCMHGGRSPRFRP